MDYSILDIRTFFTPHEAAMAWCEIIEVTKDNQHNYRHIYHEIEEAIRTGQLHAEIPVTPHESWITGERWVTRHPEHAKIARDELKRWAETLGRKPKFLFPEMREQAVMLTPSDVSSLIQDAGIGTHQKRITEWKATAQAQWEKEPWLTQIKVAEFIRGESIKNKKGEFSVKTIIKHIKDFDPREHRVGRNRKDNPLIIEQKKLPQFSE